MHCPIRFLLAMVLTGGPLFARTWTDAQGRTIEAEFIKSSGSIITIRRADGRIFELPSAGLSPADRDYIVGLTPPVSGQSSTTAKVSFSDINTLFGVDLLANDNLWDDIPSDVAKRLNLPLEGKTPHFESYRAYPADKPIAVLGTRAYMIALQSTEGKITAVTFMFANRGDYPVFLGRDPRSFPSAKELKDFDRTLKIDFETLSTALTTRLGLPKSEMAVSSLDPRRHFLRWEYGAQAFVVSHDAEQMVSLKIVPTDRSGTHFLSEEQVRRMLKERLTKRPNGDIIIDQIPMVDQGPKGYCVPATFERYLRYVGVPADMYELAAVGGTEFGGGSSFEAMAASLDRYVRQQGRHLEKAAFPFSIDGVARYLNEGRPIIWGHFSTHAFNDLSNALTEARQTTTDWAQWKKSAAKTDVSKLRPDSTSGHACLIIGYNRATNEIAFTDSWGPHYAERWVPIAAAQKISQDEFWVISR